MHKLDHSLIPISIYHVYTLLRWLLLPANAPRPVARLGRSPSWTRASRWERHSPGPLYGGSSTRWHDRCRHWLRLSRRHGRPAAPGRVIFAHNRREPLQSPRLALNWGEFVTTVELPVTDSRAARSGQPPPPSGHRQPRHVTARPHSAMTIYGKLDSDWLTAARGRPAG